MKNSCYTRLAFGVGFLAMLPGGCPVPETMVSEIEGAANGPAIKPSVAADEGVELNETEAIEEIGSGEGSVNVGVSVPIPGTGVVVTLPEDFLTAPPQSLPYGTWLVESGSMLPTFIQGLATFSTTADVTALMLNNDGTGRVFFRDRLTGAKDCVQTFVLFNGDTLVLDFGAETVTDVVFNVALDDKTFFFPVVDVGPNFLGLADEDGTVVLLSRQQSLPADVDCGTLEVVDQFDGLPAPQFFTDVVLFNGDLVYASGTTGQLETFDLGTDALGTPLGPVSSRLVQTTQGSFFWTHCGCGGSRDAFKRTLSSVVDTVNSETEMGGPITFRAMAYDAMNDRLWLHGRPFDDSFGRFFVMNTNGEPDVVEREVSFNRDLRALAFDGADLWGIVTVASQSVVQIDPATGKVLESYEVPDMNVSWSGLVFDASHMYLMGTDADGEGVIYRVMRP